MKKLLETLKALGDETRLRIAAILLAGSFNVNELVGMLGMGQSRVSRHLKILLAAGLVEARRQGSRVYYRLSACWWPPVAQGGGSGGPDEFFVGLASRLRPGFEFDAQAINDCLEERRQRAEKFFSGVARRFDAERDRVQGPPGYLDRLVAHLDHVPIVVDLGTGTGVLLPDLSPRAGRVIGVDASAEMLRVARENMREKGLENVEFRLGALEHLPFADGEVDAMVANMVLHHVARPQEALEEVSRSLGPGGKLLIADFRPHSEEEYRERLGDLWLGFDTGELERWLHEAELDVEWLEDVTPATSGGPAVFLAVASKPFPPVSGRSTHSRKELAKES